MNLHYTTEKIMESINSDRSSDCLASQCFNDILNHIQDSCLNFHMQLTPFGAKISLKKSFIVDKKGVVVLPFTKYEPGITKYDEEKVPIVQEAEKDVEDDGKANERVAEGVANNLTVKNQNGEAVNNVDEMDKKDGFDDHENVNVEESVIEEMETIYNVSTANYFSPLMIPSSADITSTNYSPTYLSSSNSTAPDHPPPQHAQLPDPEGDQQQHQLAHDQDDHWEEPRKMANTSEAKKYEGIELEVKEEGFIGPRLPRVMTNEEFKAVMDRLLGDKYN